MTEQLSRRDFVAAAGVVAAAPILAGRWPSPVGGRPPAAVRTILFQGDSITDAGRDRAEHRPGIGAALGTGYPLLLSAQLMHEHPQQQLACYNRGVSGDRVPDLASRWAGDTLALKPDLLSILVGVNDFWHKLFRGYSGTVEDYERAYSALLQRTRAALPSVSFVIMEPFALPTGAVDARWHPEFDQRRAAAQRVAQTAGATYVPLQAMFDDLLKDAPAEYWSADGVHPTPAGHAAIAHAWRQAVGL